MRDPDFWSDYAKAMNMRIEGDRLIAKEIATTAARRWQRLGHAISRFLRRRTQHHQSQR